jgi:pimeloyl-ACP methyl ester carboxylesterase
VAAGSDVLALIEHLGGAAVVVIGNSMGAGAGVWAAAERPGQVAGLALTGPFVRDPKINPLMQQAFRLAMSGPWAVRTWLSYLPRLYPSGKPGDFAGHLASLRESMRRPGHAKAFAATTRTSHAPAQERLPRVAGKPVLIVMGEKDLDFPDPRRSGVDPRQAGRQAAPGPRRRALPAGRDAGCGQPGAGALLPGSDGRCLGQA